MKQDPHLFLLQVIRWSDPESDIEIKKNTFYAPMRIQAEEAAMESGYNPARFNMADYYGFVRYPFHARFTDPNFWHTQQMVKSYKRLVKGQPFIRERLIVLGPDLAAAHFLCHRNCRVKFVGRNEWTELDNKTYRMPNYVPQDNIQKLAKK